MILRECVLSIVRVDLREREQILRFHTLNNKSSEMTTF